MTNEAIQLASFGFRVHPVAMNKRPVLAGWPGVATTDADIITAWWDGRFSGLQVGIATGERSGICVLDIDGCDGERSFDWMVERLGELPNTVTAKTPRGRHIYGRWSEGMRNRTNMGGMKGIDLRGEGGYVIAPPSVSELGEYHWLASPDCTPIAEWPDAWKAAFMDH